MSRNINKIQLAVGGGLITCCKYHTHYVYLMRYVYTCRAYSRHWWDECVYQGFFLKRAFYLLAPPKKMSFLTIPNEDISFKTQGNKLGAISCSQQSSRISPDMYKSVSSSFLRLSSKSFVNVFNFPSLIGQYQILVKTYPCHYELRRKIDLETTLFL